MHTSLLMQACGFGAGTTKTSNSKVTCELLAGGDLDRPNAHQCSFQILILSPRINQKIDSEKLTVSRLLVFSTQWFS